MLLWDDPGSTSFVLTAIALVIWVVGILVVSNVWKTPTYNMILAGDPEAMPADWEATRQRYFTINWLQLVDDLGGVRPLPGRPDLPLRRSKTHRELPGTGRRAALVAGASCSRHTQGC